MRSLNKFLISAGLVGLAGLVSCKGPDIDLEAFREASRNSGWEVVPTYPPYFDDKTQKYSGDSGNKSYSDNKRKGFYEK